MSSSNDDDPSPLDDAAMMTLIGGSAGVALPFVEGHGARPAPPPPAAPSEPKRRTGTLAAFPAAPIVAPPDRPAPSNWPAQPPAPAPMHAPPAGHGAISHSRPPIEPPGPMGGHDGRSTPPPPALAHDARAIQGGLRSVSDAAADRPAAPLPPAVIGPPPLEVVWADPDVGVDLRQVFRDQLADADPDDDDLASIEGTIAAVLARVPITTSPEGAWRRRAQGHPRGRTIPLLVKVTGVLRLQLDPVERLRYLASVVRAERMPQTEAAVEECTAALENPLALEIGQRAERLIGKLAVAVGAPFRAVDDEVRERLAVSRAFVKRDVFGSSCMKATLSGVDSGLTVYVPNEGIRRLPLYAEHLVTALLHLRDAPEPGLGDGPVGHVVAIARDVRATSD
jgi:hypothetical protein